MSAFAIPPNLLQKKLRSDTNNFSAILSLNHDFETVNYVT